MFIQDSERDFFSPNCSKFALEYDWNNKVFQSVQTFKFLEKISFFFREKLLNVFKIIESGNFS